MANSSSKFKLGRDSLTYLMIKYPQHTKPYKRYSMDSKTRTDAQLGIDRLERIFLKGKTYEWAILYDNKTASIIHYYHPTRNTQQLNKNEYSKAIGKTALKLYLIYNAAYKMKTGRTKGLSVPIKELTEVEQYWNTDIERIMIYQNGQHSHNFIKGQFFKT